jgi:hypothetical protein
VVSSLSSEVWDGMTMEEEKQEKGKRMDACGWEKGRRRRRL